MKIMGTDPIVLAGRAGVIRATRRSRLVRLWPLLVGLLPWLLLLAVVVKP